MGRVAAGRAGQPVRNGCREVAADMAARRVTGRYGGPCAGGVVTVSLAPSGPHDGTDVAVVVSASLDGGYSS